MSSYPRSKFHPGIRTFTMHITAPEIKTDMNARIWIFLSNKKRKREKEINSPNSRPFFMSVTTLLLWRKYLFCVHLGKGSLRKSGLALAKTPKCVNERSETKAQKEFVSFWVFLWLCLSVYLRRTVYSNTTRKKHLAAMSNIPASVSGPRAPRFVPFIIVCRVATPGFCTITPWAVRATFSQQKGNEGINLRMYLVLQSQWFFETFQKQFPLWWEGSKEPPQSL